MSSLSFLRQMLQDVRHQKMRTLLTLFGITWGTVSVALLVSFGEALQKRIVMSATYRQNAATDATRLEKDFYNRLFSRGPRFRMDGETRRRRSASRTATTRTASAGARSSCAAVRASRSLIRPRLRKT